MCPAAQPGGSMQRSCPFVDDEMVLKCRFVMCIQMSSQTFKTSRSSHICRDNMEPFEDSSLARGRTVAHAESRSLPRCTCETLARSYDYSCNWPHYSETCLVVPYSGAAPTKVVQ